MVARTAEQPGMGRKCGAAALEKAVAGGCAVYGKRPCAAVLEKMSDFFRDIEAHSAAASGSSAGADVRRDRRRNLSLPFIDYLMVVPYVGIKKHKNVVVFSLSFATSPFSTPRAPVLLFNHIFHKEGKK